MDKGGSVGLNSNIEIQAKEVLWDLSKIALHIFARTEA